MNLAKHMNELVPEDAAAFNALAGRLRAAPEREPSAGLADRILSAVDAERGRNRRRFRAPAPWWGTLLAASLAIALSLLSVYQCRNRVAARAGLPDGYAWLAASQESDGTWSPARHGGSEIYRPALTALSALALDRAGGYGPQIQRACDALTALQAPDGSFGGEGRVGLYNQAITTFALASLCSRHPSLKTSLGRALAGVAARQTAQGGWDYEAGSEGNAALTAWQVQTLACAEAQGFDAAKIPLRKGLRWLRGAARDDGSIAYHRGSAARSDGLSALAAYALITAGKDFPGLPELGRHVAGSLTTAAQVPAVADCYRDYAKVLAFESAGAKAQAETVRHQMVARQTAALPDQWESVGGKLYTTAFAALAAK